MVTSLIQKLMQIEKEKKKKLMGMGNNCQIYQFRVLITALVLNDSHRMSHKATLLTNNFLVLFFFFFVC